MGLRASGLCGLGMCASRDSALFVVWVHGSLGYSGSMQDLRATGLVGGLSRLSPMLSFRFLFSPVSELG